MANPEDINTIEQLEEEFEKVFLMEDKGIVRLVACFAIANRLDLDVFWIMLVAPPSGGKTEMISTLNGLDFVYPISDLTVNTFMSGQTKAGKETSLLLEIGNGIIAFKDFTTLLTKNKESKDEIMGQFRQISDGYYIKGTGTGNRPSWKGRISIIGGVTEQVYMHMEQMAAMGDRFLLYNIAQPDEEAASERVFENAPHMEKSRKHLQECMKHFVLKATQNIDESDVVLDEETRKDIIQLAIFATRARSAVNTDFKTGEITFVPKKEMPMRFIQALNTLSAGFLAMHRIEKGMGRNHSFRKLTDKDRQVIYKVALDSVPKPINNVIIPLAQYDQGLTTAQLATLISLPTQSTVRYLRKINALGICDRIKRAGGNRGDLWQMKEEYRDVILKFNKLELLVDEPPESVYSLEDEHRPKEEVESLDQGLL